MPVPVARRKPALRARRQPPPQIPLPRWPVTAMFAFFLVWWALGIGDLIWGLMAIPMLGYLAGSGQRVRVPRGFGIWLLFLAWMCASVIEIDTGGRLFGFLFRLTIYFGATVAFVYVYNGDRKTLSIDYLAGVLSIFWILLVIGGFLAVWRPNGTITTPLAFVMPHGLASNELVAQMIRPRFTQGDPNGYFDLALRPSAPFAYANGWGTNYSLTLPFVLVKLSRMRRDHRFWMLAALVPLSLIPAFSTQNRGMLLAISIAIIYVGLRQLRRGHVGGLVQIAFLVIAGGLMTLVIPVNQLIADRLAESDTNGTRLAVYTEAIQRTMESPLLGRGAPRPSTVSIYAPSVGTQGQFWFVLFSYGFVGAFLWMAWFLSLAVRTAPAPDTSLLWLHTVLLMMSLECMFYGMMHSALVITMLTGGLALRELAWERSRRPVADRASPGTSTGTGRGMGTGTGSRRRVAETVS